MSARGDRQPRVFDATSDVFGGTAFASRGEAWGKARAAALEGGDTRLALAVILSAQLWWCSTSRS
jgi:hypothetical protein